MIHRWLEISIALLAAVPAIATSQELGLSVQLAPGGDAIVAHASGPPGKNFLIESGRDLSDWWPVAASHEVPWTFSDPDIDLHAAGYYRLRASDPQAIIAHRSWKKEIALPGDPFQSDPVLTGYDQQEVRFIKFSIILENAPWIYFQDAAQYDFHYNFATERLAPFSAMTPEQFDQVSLHRQGQEVVLGAVLFAPRLGEYAVQLVGADAYPPEMTRFLIEAVDQSVARPESWRLYYFPTLEQSAAAEKGAAYLRRHGIEVASIARWQTGDSCYSEGWALGRLVFVSAEDIDRAYLDGELVSTDILLTDGIPAEVPYVAGIISTAPATPNAHVAILARSYGIPFVYLSDPLLVDEAMALEGGDVILRTDQQFITCDIDLIDASGLSSMYREEILALKVEPALELTPKAHAGSISRGLDSAVPGDIQFVGGKAANFGYLRKTIPSNSPRAMAFTFDLWNEFMSQVLPGGDGNTTLGAEIASRLAPYSWPADISQLDAELRGIRDLIKDVADFSPPQRSAIISELQSFGFDPMRKIRFRSSTNVEDTGSFVGAGLYDSYSGCLQDDLDADDIGPSHCDPDEPGERGVFRALRKVYASFYNLNAFIERLRRGADESQVGMAALVHYSFPDEIEAANGVVTLGFNGSPTSSYQNSTLVSQTGATSITNPDGNSLPEVVISNGFRNNNSGGNDVTLTQRSSLLQLGIFSVMEWQADYLTLIDLCYDVAVAYRRDADRASFVLEFEFKKQTDGKLVIKQVREVPAYDATGSEFAAFVGEGVELEVFQGEAGDLWSNHRLKSRFTMDTDSRWLDPGGLARSLITRSDWQYVEGAATQTKAGKIPDWQSPGFGIVSLGGSDYAEDSWHEPSFAATSARFTFSMQIPAPYQYARNPVQTLGDQQLGLGADYATPQFYYDGFSQEPSTRMADFVRLARATSNLPLESGAVLVERKAATGSGISIGIDFYWPSPVAGPVAGYTAPLLKWKETTITGLTAEPISLSGYWSQTYRPGHHNFTEEFLFEPRLEPGVPASTLAELQAQNVKQIYVRLGFVSPVIKAVGFDDSMRGL